MACGLAACGQPGLRSPAGTLEGMDLVCVLQREADAVEPMQQAVLAERLEFEVPSLATLRADELLVHVDRQRAARAIAREREEPIHGVVAQDHRKQAPLE